MKYMFKVFREEEWNKYEQVYQHRKNFEAAVDIPFTIKPIKSNKIYPLYFIPTIQLMNLLNKIYKQDKMLSHLFNRLPGVAKKNFLFESLIEELQNTNDLEGVKSSKEEIVRSARNLERDQESKERFSSMIQLYNKLENDELQFLEKPEDVRDIYNDLVLEEISEDEHPDGEIFRKDITHVYKNSGTGKVIHYGVTPEEKIIKLMNRMITFLNQEDEVPFLIKVAVSHYYFGYIHPFYDGNGRTSRFISSMYLNKELNFISAISLSRGCNKYRSKYAEAFEKSNGVPNSGEMNFFIDVFLEIIMETQGEMIEELKLKNGLLVEAQRFIQRTDFFKEKNEMYREIFFVLVQHHYFAFSEGFTVQGLAKVFKRSDQYIRKVLAEMLEAGLVVTKGKRPVYYFVNDALF